MRYRWPTVARRGHEEGKGDGEIGPYISGRIPAATAPAIGRVPGSGVAVAVLVTALLVGVTAAPAVTSAATAPGGRSRPG